jgi:tRNA dimethylallyltransferase
MNLDRSPHFDLLIVTGPTASGKTSLAVALADMLKGEVISADSRQVYKLMNLGTGKDYNEYIVNGRQVKSHLIDIADPGYKYNVFEYQRDFLRTYNDLKSRNVFPVVCGGSGMYLDSIVSGYNMYEVPPDPMLRKALGKKSLQELIEILSTFKNLHNSTDTDTKKRVIRAIEIEHFNMSGKKNQVMFPQIKPLIIGLIFDRNKRREMISSRLKKRLKEGMVNEVKDLLDGGMAPEDLIYYGLEYKYITLYVTGKLNYVEMFRQLEIAIHQFSKRQMTWFRGMERKGIVIHWLDGELPFEQKVQRVHEMLF